MNVTAWAGGLEVTGDGTGIVIDATVTPAHSEKELAEGNFKGFGHHPLLSFSGPDQVSPKGATGWSDSKNNLWVDVAGERKVTVRSAAGLGWANSTLRQARGLYARRGERQA